MTSFKSRMFNFIMRNRHLFRGKLKKDSFNSQTSIVKFRKQCERAAEKYSKIPEGITINPEMIEGIKAEWIIPDGSDVKKVILYIHGGGYVSGSCNDHRGFVSTLAKYTGFMNLVYDYRLAPENTFPAALEDSIKVYSWLLSNDFRPGNILFAGESAGGGLCLALLLALKERKIPLPAAAMAISPWADLTCSGDSYKTKNKVSVAPKNSWTVFSNHYVGAHKADDPLISPVFGDLRGLPPIFINSATDDECYEDGEKLYKNARDAGVKVFFRAGIGMVHCYPLLAPRFKEATEAMEEIRKFIREHLQ